MNYKIEYEIEYIDDTEANITFIDDVSPLNEIVFDGIMHQKILRGWYNFMSEKFPETRLLYVMADRILKFKLPIHEIIKMKMLL